MLREQKQKQKNNEQKIEIPKLSPVSVGLWRDAAINNRSLAFTNPPAPAINWSAPGSPGGNDGLVKSRDLSLLYLTFNAVSLLLSIRRVQHPL